MIETYKLLSGKYDSQVYGGPFLPQQTPDSRHKPPNHDTTPQFTTQTSKLYDTNPRLTTQTP